MTAFLNRCIWIAASAGTGSFVVSAAAQNGYVPADCLDPVVVDGATYNYFATNGTEHEEGDGVYDVATATLTRATVRNSSNTGSAVDFAAAPVVTMGGPIATDIPSPFRTLLTADANYYVDNVTGSNSNPGTIGSPFATLQYAWDYLSGKLDGGGNNNVIIHCAASGTPYELDASSGWVGCLSVSVIGDSAATTSGSFSFGNDWQFIVGPLINFNGFTIAGVENNIIKVDSVVTVSMGGTLLPIFADDDIIFADGSFVTADGAGALIYMGDFTVQGDISFNAALCGQLFFFGVCTLTGTPDFSEQFAYAGMGIILVDGGTIVGAGTGKKFVVAANGIIDAGGDPDFFPGDSPGTIESGGQYIGLLDPAGQAVDDLPDAAIFPAGYPAFVTDSTADLPTGLGDVVAGGGANAVPVYSDQTDWRIG